MINSIKLLEENTGINLQALRLGNLIYVPNYVNKKQKQQQY